MRTRPGCKTVMTYELVTVALHQFHHRVTDAPACARRKTDEDHTSGRAMIGIDELPEVLVLRE